MASPWHGSELAVRDGSHQALGRVGGQNITLSAVDEQRGTLQTPHGLPQPGSVPWTRTVWVAENRIDFRDLVRDLANTLRVRVEMKQIGARDETKVTGGLGPCGRELCCSSSFAAPSTDVRPPM